MSGAGFDVDREHLAAVGGQVVNLADGLSKAVGELVGGMSGMSGQNRGFGCVGVLYSCLDGWRAEVEGLGAGVAAGGDKLVASARGYAVAEGQNCACLRPH